MHTDVLETQLVAYLSLREALGCQMRAEKIILPEFVPRVWWHHLLHNQTALLVKGALLFRRNVIVADVPYHLKY